MKPLFGLLFWMLLSAFSPVHSWGGDVRTISLDFNRDRSKALLGISQQGVSGWLTISDRHGRKILSQYMSDMEIIDLRSFSPGLYFIEFKAEGITLKKKFIHFPL